MILRARIGLIAWFLLAAQSQGATDHWAYQPPRSPTVPSVQAANWVRTPIDAFVLNKLESERLGPAARAEPRTLLRRLFLDLTGLPPTPAEVDEFLAEPGAYERWVDRLLASPRYGERWARLWMDAVHFAETHGHDQDRIRTNAWPYRDYLVSSFNADKGYGRFLEEQVAGDILYPNEPQATVALGLIAAGPWDESSLRDIREDTLDRQIGRYLDRDDMVTTVMQTFTSTTAQCARCHDHKFDPISQEDYYALQAVFSGVDRANRPYDADPDLHRRRQELLSLLRRVEQGDRKVLLSPAAALAVAEGEKQFASAGARWSVLRPLHLDSTDGTTLVGQEDGSVLATGPRPERDTYRIRLAVPAGNWTALRLEVLADQRLPQGGPGRQDNGNLHLSELKASWLHAGQEIPAPLVHPTADFNQEGWTIEHALDGDEGTAWGIYPRVGQGHVAVFEFGKTHTATASAELTVSLLQLHGQGHLIGRVRLSLSDAPLPVQAIPLAPALQELLAVEPSERDEAARIELASFFYKAKLTAELQRFPAPSFVYAAAAEFAPDGGLKPAGGPRPVHVLQRGDITMPLTEATPGALSCVEKLSPRFENLGSEGARRAALARWLSHRDNPLVWRSIVNRVWLWHFGSGLVETPNDFGKLGAEPSHPELLDWLTIWFRDNAQGSLKQLHRLLLTSAAWQQSCQPTTGAEAAIDAGNRWLWRMNRRRLDAEQVRDSILQMCDRFDLRMGGPSDQQFGLKPGIHVTPQVDYSAFDVDDPAGRRRAVYRFLFRTLPDPFMDALDCPSGDELAPVRHSSVTVQHALALWNNAFVVRHAEHLAARLKELSRGGHPAEGATAEKGRGGNSGKITDQAEHSLALQVGLGFELVLGRPPTVEEAREFVAYAELHGLANFCRLLLNSNEFMFVN